MLKDIMCGDEAAKARSMLQITYPVSLTQWLCGFVSWRLTWALRARRWRMG